MNIYLYALCDPKSGELYYVGLTSDPEARLSRHRKALDCGCWEKHAAMEQAGLRPIMTRLETFTDPEEAKAAEKATILSLREQGYKLLNIRAGGNYHPRKPGVSNRRM